MDLERVVRDIERKINEENWPCVRQTLSITRSNEKYPSQALQLPWARSGMLNRRKRERIAVDQGYKKQGGKDTPDFDYPKRVMLLIEVITPYGVL